MSCEYCEPPKGWSLDKDPQEMNYKELTAAAARDILGCKVYWWPHYKDWCCGCDGTPHSCDQQCSAIMFESQLWPLVAPVLRAHGIRASSLREALEKWWGWH